MTQRTSPISTARGWLARVRGRTDWMMLFPAVAAVAWTFGQDAVAMALVLVLPVFLALDQRTVASPPGAMMDRRMSRAAVQRLVEDTLQDCARRDRTTAVLHVQVDDPHFADGDWTADMGERIMDRVTQRVSSAMRGQDAVTRVGDDGMVVVLAPTRRADLDVVMNIVDRIQSAVAEPVSLDGRAVRVQCSIGICSEAMAPARTGAAMLAAADCALRIARRQGDGAVRAFNPTIRSQVETDHRLAGCIEDALAGGEIRPWFQPQIDSRTGRLAGFEALARWHHPELGVLTPGQFLPTITSAGRSADLGEQILKASLEALIEWDRAGLDVPCVGINVSLEQLADPRLAERIIWQLDRYDVQPPRVAIEILETVTLRDGDETITRNLAALRKAGFRLDLDDFGTGAASIAHIARFGVHRIKIDRSFVEGIDGDSARRTVVGAILGLARSLDIETLAEGVETPEEQATLTEMGCPHVQGFGIARPMPFAETIPWALALPSGPAESLRLMRPQGSA